MNRFAQSRLCLLALISSAMLFHGCASAPDAVYIKEAQQVTTQALEPVMLESAELENELANKFAQPLKGIPADELMTVIQTEIANTKRFTKVLDKSDGDTYIIQPRIERVDTSLVNIPTDPTRKKFISHAKVRLDVLFINQKNQKELVKSFYDDRKLEERISAKTGIDDDQKKEFLRRAVSVAFRAAADQLGNGFNPSYEMGSVSKINGKIAYVQINTSKLLKMPKKQQAVEVVDDDNKVLASLGELSIGDGNLTGKVYEKSGATVREGSKVRAKVNALVD